MNVPSQESVAEALLAQSPVCSWALDRNLRFEQVYGDSVPIFGELSENLRGRSLEGTLEAATADIWRAGVERAFAGEQVHQRIWVGERSFAVAHFPIRGSSRAVRHSGGVAHEITAQSEVEQELRRTTLKVLHSQEEERLRLSRMLHDDIGQSLSAVGLQLDLLRMDLEPHAPEIRGRTREIQDMLDHVMQRAREFSYELNPAIVERTGLHGSLDTLVGRMRRKFLGQVRLSLDPSVTLPPETASALYKIGKEAFENAVEHSGGSLVEITLKRVTAGVALQVRDDGGGFNAADLARSYRGLGLLVMEHYAIQTDLRLSIASGKGKGTLVQAVFRNGKE